MSAIRITRRQLGALARYHELLATCRRLGNIARARSRVLREEWSACGLEPARRSLLLGRHVFHGVILTPRAAEAVDRGLPPSESALVAHAGVLLAATESPPDFELRNPEMPELQVGLWLEAPAGAVERHQGLIDALEQNLGGAGYTILAHHSEICADPIDDDTRWVAYAMVRRLSLASLLDEDDPASAAARFYSSALKPLEALEDEQIGMLLQLTGHGDVCERELPR